MPAFRDGPVARIAVALLALVIAATAVTAVIARFRTDTDQPTLAPDGSVVRLGPQLGTNVATWIQHRQTELATAEGRLRAVVSFVDYMDQAEAHDLVSPLRPDEWLVALPGTAPEVVDDVDEWLSNARQRIPVERAEFQSLIPTTDQDEFVEDYRQQVQRLTELEAALARDAAPAVIFGAIVQADADELRSVASRAGVRVLDGIDHRVRARDPRGLLPEERIKAGEPGVRERPLR